MAARTPSRYPNRFDCPGAYVMPRDDIDLLREISARTFCAPHLPLGPRPVLQFSATSRILIIGQAPGTKVHASGIPWQDDSGDRLREWTGLGQDVFYDPTKVALMPMGFCYPGKAAGGDAPPRPAPSAHRGGTNAFSTFFRRND